MLTRTGDYAQATRTSQLLLEAQTRARATQIQISTGKVARQFSGIASDASRLVSAKDALQRFGEFQHNNTLVGQRLEVMEASTASLIEIATRLRVLLIQRLDSAQGVPGTISANVGQLLQQAVSDLNAELDGRYLFAGSRTDRQAVALDPAFGAFGAPDDTYYQGDAVELTVHADVDHDLTYGMTADRQGFQELIGALRAAGEGDGSDDRALLESALDLVNAALPRIAGYQGEIGAGRAALDRINLGHGDAELYLESQISDIENVDLSDAITRLAQDQMVIESAMATIAQLNRLSLVDFLR
jgi:flagellar hook-associated protein 3 FlgL